MYITLNYLQNFYIYVLTYYFSALHLTNDINLNKKLNLNIEQIKKYLFFKSYENNCFFFL